MEIKVDDLRKHIGLPVLLKYTVGSAWPTKVEEWIIVKKVTYTKERVKVSLIGGEKLKFPKDTEHTELFAVAQ